MIGGVIVNVAAPESRAAQERRMQDKSGKRADIKLLDYLQAIAGRRAARNTMVPHPNGWGWKFRRSGKGDGVYYNGGKPYAL
jgi:hypothetical protein